MTTVSFTSNEIAAIPLANDLAAMLFMNEQVFITYNQCSRSCIWAVPYMEVTITLSDHLHELRLLTSKFTIMSCLVKNYFFVTT